MTPRRVLAIALFVSLVFAPAVLLSAEKPAKSSHAKQYQVTGTVLSVDDDMVVVQKGDEKWEIDLAADTKSDTKPRKGDKVLIHYHMTANSIEVKADK